MKTDCIIIGGGAAGLVCANALASGGLRVTLLERQDRIGKKLLATGNGRCNLSNVDMNPNVYGASANFVRTLYDIITPDEVLSFFSSLGLLTAVEDGRIYPRTRQAASALDVLRDGLSAVEVRTNAEVVSLMPSRRGGWSVQLSSGEGVFAPRVVCCMGGSAAPNMGTDGSGTNLLRALGHSVTPLYPALVQLKCGHPALKSLKGLRVPARLTLLLDDCETAQEDGELLFADYGVSGVCVFQLSRFVASAIIKRRKVQLRVNFLPEIPGCFDWLEERASSRPCSTTSSLLTGALPRMLAQAICKQSQVSMDSVPTQEQLLALADAISAFTLDITGTQGFANAQVTRGGVSLDEVDPKTMESRIFPSLYICGETLDVDGPCGGYNLHFAFASALAAAKDIIVSAQSINS